MDPFRKDQRMNNLAEQDFIFNKTGRRPSIIHLIGCARLIAEEERGQLLLFEPERRPLLVPMAMDTSGDAVVQVIPLKQEPAASTTKHRSWFPLYPGDYLADTRDLTVEQHGVYMLLLMCAWLRSDCALPNDKDFLRGILPHMHGLTFNRLVPPILKRFFELGTDNVYRQKRLSKEADKARELAEKQRRNVEERWKKIKRNEANTNKHNNLADTTGNRGKFPGGGGVRVCKV
jgi:uncharacterized protein YdaU (DUF1376 family)